MKFSNLLLLALIAFFISSSRNASLACSMYKVTADGKTMVGCNEDAWRTTSRIWFETSENSNGYGAVYTGSRQVSANKFAPQSGMNEAGLVFSRLTSYHPRKSDVQHDKKKIIDEVSYLSDILKICASVEEVSDFIVQYDHSIFIDDVFIYVDSTGQYLVVEPYNLIKGDDAHYVLSNFCPSITEKEKARKLERYSRGEDFLNAHKAEATLSFCTALSDTMHVCRNRNGDGTLLTSIWDTKDGLVNLFFYHKFDTTIQFNLVDELAKGDHILNVTTLFPINTEFERLTNYKTPFNTPPIRILLVLLAGLLGLFSLAYGFFFLFNRKNNDSNTMLLVFSFMNLLTICYFFVLATNMYIYYFDAPYKHHSSKLISMSSYTPIILLLTIIPIFVYVFQYLSNKGKKSWIFYMQTCNVLVYIAAIIGFRYWGLFNVFN